MDTSPTSSMNFERTCRLCVKESTTLNPICHSENPLSDLIKECVDIVVRVEDELPKHVCQDCLDQMESWKSFKTSCQKSEDFLCSVLNRLHCSIADDGDAANLKENASKDKSDKSIPEEEEPSSRKCDSKKKHSKEEENSCNSKDEPQEEGGSTSEEQIQIEETYHIEEGDEDKETSQMEENPQLEEEGENDESSQIEGQIMVCDDNSGSSTESADSIECIDTTKNDPPKKNQSPLIRLADPEAFKLLIEAEFLETNRNLYRSLCSENYFACTADKVVQGQNCLLLELEKNVFCEVEFVMDGFLRTASELSETRDEDSQMVETILTESENTVNVTLSEKDGVQYIILPAEGETELSESQGNLLAENQKELNPSILQSILKSNSESGSKEALMFHKYARSPGEKAVKFLIPPSADSGSHFMLPVTSQSGTTQFYQIVPSQTQLVNQPNLITTKGIKRSISDSGVSVPKKQKVLMPAPTKAVTVESARSPRKQSFSPGLVQTRTRSKLKPILKPSVQNVLPARKQPSSKLAQPSPGVKSNDAGNKFANKFKSTDDISQRIQQIIEANEEILQKTWGQYKKEEEEMSKEQEEQEEEEQIFSIPIKSAPDQPHATGKYKAILGRPPKSPAKPTTRFILQPIQNKDGETGQQKEKTSSENEGDTSKQPLVNSTPLSSVPFTLTLAPLTTSLPKVPIPRLPVTTRSPPVKPKLIPPILKAPKAAKSSCPKNAKTKNIDDILFEGLDLETSNLSTNYSEESASEKSEVKYTITEEGHREPVVATSLLSSKKSWKEKVPEHMKMDPATIPKNKQRSQILQRFYLPTEPTVFDGETSNVVIDHDENDDGIKDVLFWADQLPDPPKDDENEADQTTNNQNGLPIIRRIRKRKRKIYKKKPKPKIYQCHLCENVAYAKFYELTHHDKEYHGELPANEACGICGKCFIFEDRVHWHQSIYHAEKTMFCDLCDKGFSNKERLNMHKRLHSDKFICDDCGYRAPTSRKLVEHARKHTGEKPYMCHICGMRLASKVSVKQHALKHTKEKPREKWQCKDCEYSSMNMTSFYNHRKRHQTVSTFLCEECGQNVLTKSRLYKHMRFAHGPETLGHYVCGECMGIFHSKTACDDHLKEKHNMNSQSRSFVCKLCFKSYATKAACKKHFRTHNIG
ncbi:unnamed protein product [Bemisia tabaci]|uniref:Uncharacterized protein n=1 Tax=Bemisia tabaci TaxID=7038 RepID=A0A9P0ALS7_BEMTA|nr:unnamed protein product [Bemisia tabaci]